MSDLWDSLDSEDPAHMLAMSEQAFFKFPPDVRTVVRMQATAIRGELERLFPGDLNSALEEHRDLLVFWTNEILRPIIGDIEQHLPESLVYPIVVHTLSIALLLLEPDVPEPLS